MLCFTCVVRAQFVYKYKAKRFDDVDLYIHQMLFSFQRYGDISVALEDVARVSDGQLCDTILAAIKLRSQDWSAESSEKALALIEKEYECDKIKVLHKFLISATSRGGDYLTSLKGLISDFDRWVLRVYRKQEELRRIRMDTGIGVIICALVGSISILMTRIMGGSDINMDISGKFGYQIVSALFFIACIIYYTVVQSHFTGEWLAKPRDDDSILDDYNKVFHNRRDEDRKTVLIISAVMLLIGAVVIVGGMSIITDDIFRIVAYAIGAMFMFFALFCAVKSSAGSNMAKKRLEKDIYEAFPEWLRDVSINMQYSPIRRAIADTKDNCPAVLKEPLERFIDDITEHPNSVEPYYDFLKEFNITDISTAMKTLYSFDELEKDEVDDAINTLIERAYTVVDKREELKAKDEIGVMSFIQVIPTGFLSMKIATDMLLIVMSYI